MNEVPQEIPITIVSREKLETKLGEIAKNEVVFNGSSLTVYSNGPTDGLQAYIEDIISAEEAAKDPIVVDIGDKTPEQFIEQEIEKYIEDVRTNKYSPKPKEKQSALDPLVKQRAMKKVFDEANKTNPTQS